MVLALEHCQSNFGDKICDMWVGDCMCGRRLSVSFVLLAGSTDCHIMKVQHGPSWIVEQKYWVDRELILPIDETVSAYNVVAAMTRELMKPDRMGRPLCSSVTKWIEAYKVLKVLIND